jgi:hypothetical protein
MNIKQSKKKTTGNTVDFKVEKVSSEEKTETIGNVHAISGQKLRA